MHLLTVIALVQNVLLCREMYKESMQSNCVPENSVMLVWNLSFCSVLT
jgi:hypothetical protein